MTKPTITRIWLGGLLGFVAGLVVAGIGLTLMLVYSGTWVPAASGSGSEFIPRTDGFFWSTVALVVIGGVIVLAGATAQLVALIGALVNTYRLPDRTWFVVLLVGGLLGLSVGVVGFAAMLAYVIAGPDALTHETAPHLPVPPMPISPTPAPPRAAPSPPAPSLPVTPPASPPAPEAATLSERSDTLVPMA